MYTDRNYELVRGHKCYKSTRPGIIRPYATFLCSMCMPGEGDDVFMLQEDIDKHNELILEGKLYPKFHAKTLANEPIISDCEDFRECVKKVREYQQANGNPLVKIDVEEVVRHHHTIITPMENNDDSPKDE